MTLAGSYHHRGTVAPHATAPARKQPAAPAGHPAPNTWRRVTVGPHGTIRRRFPLLRLALGAVWLTDGLLQWQPGVFRGFLDLIQQSAQNQPAPLQASITWGAGLLAHVPALANGALATVEVLIGLALLLGVRGRQVLIASMLLAFPIWVLGEGLGQVFSGSTTDIGAAPLYVLLALAVLLGQGWHDFNLVPALARRSELRSVYRVEGVRGWR
jgi:hypothetical protein